MILRLSALLVAFAASASGQQAAPAPEFLDHEQRQALARLTLDGIESVDAMVIGTRNRTRDVQWPEFRQHIQTRMEAATDWRTLNRVIDDLHSGITNLHSSVTGSDRQRGEIAPRQRWPRLDFGYTWPQLSFFGLNNQQNVDQVNGQPVADLFSEYFNWYCRDLHQSACADSFVRHLKEGYPFAEPLTEITVTYTNQTQATFSEASDWQYNPDPNVACADLYPGLPMDLVYESAQTCLFSTDDSYVLKIKYFGQWGADYFDIHCRENEGPGMCEDINKLTEINRAVPKPNLVIDVQSNPGGTENTPWLAALTRQGFDDNLVQYRNLSQLQNDAFREAVFYFVEPAQRWYDSLNASEKQARFLPTRADFCRGDATCGIKTIPSNATPIAYENLKVISGPRCVSSCDDLVWRLREFAGATVFGQLHATDSAYARAEGVIYLTEQGEIKRLIVGDGQAPSLSEQDEVLLAFRVPITRTINSKGVPLDANPESLDNPLEVTKSNFAHLTEDNLRKVLLDSTKAGAATAANSR